MKLLSLSIALVMLSACSSLAPQPPVEQPPTQPLSTFPETWSLNAKMGIVSPDNSGSVSLKWQQNQQRYQVQTSASFGQGKMFLTGSDTSLLIERPGQAPLFSYNPDQLVTESIGWPLPLTSLPYWIKGIANPSLPIEDAQYDPNDTLRTLSQAGWLVTYSRYKNVQEWLIPHKIVAKQADIRITLVIREWILP